MPDTYRRSITMSTCNNNRIGFPGQPIDIFNRHNINFIVNIEAFDIFPIAFNDINQIIH